MNSQQILSLCKSSARKTTKTNLLSNVSICHSLQPTAEDKSKIKFSPTGTYDENTNLNEIHAYICDFFSKNKNKIKDCTDKIVKLQHEIDTTKLTIVERKSILSEIKTLEKEIQELSSEEKYNEYINSSKSILEEWDLCLKRESSNRFFGTTKTVVPEKLNFVHRYIHLASKYANLNLTYETQTKKDHCPYCHQKYIVDEFDEKKFICEPCGIYFEEMSNAATFSDLSKINTCNNNDYHSKENFKNAFLYHQGKIPVEFPDDLEEKMDNYCLINHINKQKIDCELGCEIFKKIGYKNYKAINLFLSVYNGKELSNYTEIDMIIYNDQELFSQMYEKVKNEERSSAMNAQYLMYILLRKNGVNCNRKDFRIPETPKTFREIETLAKKTFAALKWSWFE